MRGEMIDNEEALSRARMALEQSSDSISPDVLAKLRIIRGGAVELAEKREQSLFCLPRWVTVGGVATLAVLVVAVSLWFSPVGTGTPAKSDDDIDIITSNEQLEFYEELDFFLWLEERENAG